MTRKDYEAIAEAVRQAQREIMNDSSPHFQQAMNWGVEKLVGEIGKVLAKDNPRFDTARFLTACGY